MQWWRGVGVVLDDAGFYSGRKGDVYPTGNTKVHAFHAGNRMSLFTRLHRKIYQSRLSTEVESFLSRVRIRGCLFGDEIWGGD